MKAAIRKASFCPFCKSGVEIAPDLIGCSDCKTPYHRECWNENRGCSVYGCTGIMQSYRNGVYFNDHGEPGWLIFLRLVVFGFIPFAMIAASFSEGSFSVSDFFILFWLLPFIPCLPTLFILEVIYLRRVLQKPELQARFGDRAYHILSLSAYGIAATAVCVVWILWEIT